MKFKILQNELARALRTSARFVSTRTQLPVLENVVFSTKRTKLLLKATNLETSLVSSVGAKVEREGEIALPARVVAELIGNISSETVSFEAKKEIVKLEADNFSARLTGMNVSDFPAVPVSVGKGAMVLAGGNFVEALEKVLFSVSRDDTRPVLTGVLFIFAQNSLVLVSSDGFRLSQKKISLKTAGKDEKRVIMPRGVLGELAKVFSEGQKRMMFEHKVAESQVVFGMDKQILGSRVIEGEYPNFEKIIPKAPRVKVMVGKEDLWGGIRTASVFAREAANVVRLVVTKEGLSILAESSKSGKQEAKIEGKVEGEGMEISYNYRFIEEFLGVVKGESVEIELTDGTSPGIFRDPKDKDYLHLIMPVRVQG